MRRQLLQDFRSLELGQATVEGSPLGLARFTIPPTPKGYADAQIDDCWRLPRHKFLWHPPLSLGLIARSSHAQPLGTLGFGFWNDPFTFSLGQGGAARKLPAGPSAVWFFYGSPPNDFSFAPGVPGHGWKAMALRSPAIPSLLLAPLAVGAAGLAQIPFLRRPIMSTALKTVQAEEIVLNTPLDQWHYYALHWEPDQVRFEVDCEQVFTAHLPIAGPLGFVAWIDNQYAVASVEGGFRFGTIPTEDTQWLEIAELSLEKPNTD
jgi:hypothetical protein